MADNTKCTLAFLGGAALGVGLGLLFAPKPGKETREDIKKWMDDQLEHGKERFTHVKDELIHKKEQMGAALAAGKKAYSEAGRDS